SSLFLRCSILAQWVLRADRTTVPKKITIRLVKVKYLTSLNGFIFSSVIWEIGIVLGYLSKGTLVMNFLFTVSPAGLIP
ncbi:MAG: hypothetical protein MUP22_03935, partial [Desulfobacterales bacterium]|nr:hypothetical protein [Desulfobacterales bacterium]